MRIDMNWLLFTFDFMQNLISLECEFNENYHIATILPHTPHMRPITSSPTYFNFIWFALQHNTVIIDYNIDTKNLIQ